MRRSLVETCVRERLVYSGSCVDFRVDRVRLPDGRTARREYLSHPGAVAILPFLDRATLVLVRQYRHPVRRPTYEIPAGKLARGEGRLQCIRRELREETGFRARSVRHLLSYWPTPAFSDEILHVYVGTGLSPGSSSPDEDEFLEVKTVPYRDALRWALSGKMRDSKTLVALLAYHALRKG